MKCRIVGCPNSRLKNPEKYFFSSPCNLGRKQIWLKSTGLTSLYKFPVCEDHFDMRKDVDFFRTNGTPVLKKEAYPHRNLTQTDMALQAKLDKFNWSCFVPSCENKRLMTDKKVVFFPVPAGQPGKLWRAAVSKDERSSYASSIDEIQFCCEEHFDIASDFYKSFTLGPGVEYRMKAGIVPSINLCDSKLGILNEVKRSCLAELNAHPRVILNNDITYLYDSKFPRLIEQLRMAVTFLNVIDIKAEPIELEKMPNIKAEPENTGYEREINCEFVIKKEESNSDANPLDLEPKNYNSESESESSAATKEPFDDPDVTTDDFSTTDEESTEANSSDDSIEEESLDDDSDVDDTAPRYECNYCNSLVKNLESHVERSHLNYSKNVNRTICGLCLDRFSHQKDLRKHQSNVHGGKAYACDICDYLTETHEQIRIHIIRLHCTEKLLLCQHCGKGYKFIWELKRHVNVHMSEHRRERTHACHLCEKKFFSGDMLRVHVTGVHSNLRPYQCNVDGCNKAFKTSSYLTTHRRQVHLKQNFHSCIACGKQFSFKGNLTAHMKNVHKT